MHTISHRVLFLDFMRGFAVIVMVMGHSIDSVLSPDVRTMGYFQVYDFFRGFTAPIFLFVSGFVFSIATEKRWINYLKWGAPIRKRMARILLIFLIGYALHIPFFSLQKIMTEATPQDIAQIFQVDVLQCVAASLLILHVNIFLGRTPRIAALITLGLALGIVFLSPIIWQIDFAAIVSPVLSPYFNQQQWSLFPLFPYSAYLFLGAVAGHYFIASQSEEDQSRFARRMIVGSIVVIGFSLVAGSLPWQVYPAHDYWKTSPAFFFIRIGIVALVTTAFFYLNRLPEIVEVNVMALGQASLLVYTAHLVIVYGSAFNVGLASIVGRTLMFPQGVMTGLLVLSAMVGLVHLWRYIRANHFVPARFIQVALASMLVFYFFTRPY